MSSKIAVYSPVPMEFVYFPGAQLREKSGKSLLTALGFK